MKQISILVFLFLSLKGWAEGEKTLETLPNHNWQEITISGGINGNGYFEVEPSYSYMLSRNLGLTAGLNFMLVVNDENYYNDFTGEYESRFFDTQTLLLRPAIRFRFLVAKQNNIELFALNIEPGVYIPIGPEKYKPNILADQLGYKKMDWLYLSLKTYLTLDLYPSFLSIGYTVTDFSHEADKFRLTHTGFIQFGYTF